MASVSSSQQLSSLNQLCSQKDHSTRINSEWGRKSSITSYVNSFIRLVMTISFSLTLSVLILAV